ncbi:hypothetical protein UFOVP99_18 [uncultured Caudovirales phage]|uniref:Uncharacterized protein n=1 Tax=uncultured Caudovirales phage TaxID=2100421 RepID=A0A6J5L1Q4_9CAUD|nr:hypothetical protein UFOVP99_18 [uncultured Caudovirales phage]
MRGSLPAAAPMPEFRGAAPALIRDKQPGANAVVQAHASMAERFAAMADRSLRQVEATAERDAQAAGAAAGEARPGVQMQDGGELYRSAYNRAALESGTRRLEISARDRLAQLAEEHKADPGAFSAQAQAYRDGVLNTLPETMRPTFTQAYDTLALPFARQARANADQAMQQQRIATFNENQTSALASIERYGLLAARDPAARAALALEMDNQLGAMVALGPKEAFTFGGRQYEADPTRAGAATLPQLVEMAQRVHDRAIGATAMGEYQAGPRTEGWVEAWEKRQLEGGTMLSDQVRRVAGQMRADAAHRRALAAEGRTEARAQLQPLLLANEVASRTGGVIPHEIPPERLRAAGYAAPDVARITGGWRANQAQFTAEAELRSASTPAEVATIAARFQPGTDLFNADPRGAAQVLGLLRQRGAQIGHAEAESWAADQMAQAQATGTVPARLTPQQATGWGLTPEATTRINRSIELHAEIGDATKRAASMTPEEHRAFLAAHPLTGAQADENRQVVAAYLPIAQAQRQGLAGDNRGDFVLAGSRPLQAIANRVLAGETAALPALLDGVAAEQLRQGVPPERLQPMPPSVAQRLVAPILADPSVPGQLQRLTAVLAATPDPVVRGQVLEAMGTAGLPLALRAGYEVAARAGAPVGQRVASELAVPLASIKLQPQQTNSIRTTVAGVYQNSDRLGGLRQAQYEATGHAGFITLAQEESQSLLHIGTVRAAAASGSLGGSEAGDAYRDLFGGRQVVNRPGVLVSAPAGTDAARLTAGLRHILDGQVQRLAPGAEQEAARLALRRGNWVDAGSGFAFYPQGSPSPLPGPDGAPLLVTPGQALAVVPREATAAPSANQVGMPRGGRPSDAQRMFENLATGAGRRAP